MCQDAKVVVLPNMMDGEAMAKEGGKEKTKQQVTSPNLSFLRSVPSKVELRAAKGVVGPLVFERGPVRRTEPLLFWKS